MEYAPWQGVSNLNDVDGIQRAVQEHANDEVYVFTLHEIYLPEGEGLITEAPVFQQTRSSPNWQGTIRSTDSATGLEVVSNVVSFATCKQNMRTYKPAQEWLGVWLLMLTPKHCANNAVFCLGRIGLVFESNYDYGVWVSEQGEELLQAKSANQDIRGDLYWPKRELAGDERYDVQNYEEPRPDHTRMERYDNGKPKWHKDIEFVGVAGRRPPVFILGTGNNTNTDVFLFSQPVLYSRWSGKCGRAVNKCRLKDL